MISGAARADLSQSNGALNAPWSLHGGCACWNSREPRRSPCSIFTADAEDALLLAATLCQHGDSSDDKTHSEAALTCEVNRTPRARVSLRNQRISDLVTRMRHEGSKNAYCSAS